MHSSSNTYFDQHRYVVLSCCVFSLLPSYSVSHSLRLTTGRSHSQLVIKEPAKAYDVTQATGIDHKEVGKVMARLKKEEKMVSPKRCYWGIKE